MSIIPILKPYLNFSGGQRRHITRSSFVMLHEPTMGAMGGKVIVNQIDICRLEIISAMIILIEFTNTQQS